MKSTLGSAAFLAGFALLALAPTGCHGSGHGITGHGGSTGTPTAGQTAPLPDGGPGTDGTQPRAGDTANSVGTSSGGVTAPGGSKNTVSGSAGSTANSGGGASGGAKTGGSTLASGSPAGATSVTGGLTSAGGTTGTIGGSQTSAGNSAGTTTVLGGSVSPGGNTGGSQTTGGNSSPGGTTGLGGTSATGGSTGRTSACLPHESEWSDSSGTRCVATAVPVPGFSIDATEVTRGQYAAWLKTNPSSAGQSTACTWNTSFTPDATCMALASVCQGDGCDRHPQPCVDQCDAAAYCKAIGRSLCTDTNWLKACTSDDAYDAPYGTTFLRGICNDYTLFASTTVPVASMSGCQAPASSAFTGIFDMVGNVEEWADNCRTYPDSTEICYVRGLPFGLGAAAPLCDQSVSAKRTATSPTIGFRCCTP